MTPSDGARTAYFHEPGHPLHGQRLSCIVGVMTDPVTARPTGAISRTYIDENLRKIGKAKTLGSPAGVVRLSRDEDVLQGLHLAEGLETALSAMAKGLRPVWSTGSTALMKTFPVLDGIDCLTVIADHDATDAGEKAAREVEVAVAARGTGGARFHACVAGRPQRPFAAGEGMSPEENLEALGLHRLPPTPLCDEGVNVEDAADCQRRA